MYFRNYVILLRIVTDWTEAEANVRARTDELVGKTIDLYAHTRREHAQRQNSQGRRLADCRHRIRLAAAMLQEENALRLLAFGHIT